MATVNMTVPSAKAEIYPRLIRRVQAVLIDSVIVIAVVFMWWASLPVLPQGNLILTLAPVIVPIIALEPVLVSVTGGTPGHHLRGLRVHDAGSGKRIGLFRATVRAFARTFLGWFTFIFTMTTRRHQALHDLVVRSVVILKTPEDVFSYDRQAEQNISDETYRYPSKWRRFVVVVLYLIFVIGLQLLATRFLISSACLNGFRCGHVDTVLSQIIAYLSLLGVGAGIVLGWRGRLLGARRIRRDQLHEVS